jgi:hypothetical protein
MKTIMLTAAAVLAANAAFAGNLIMEAPEEPVVMEEKPAGSMGGSGAWLIPLLAIGLIALAVSQDDEEAQPQ